MVSDRYRHRHSAAGRITGWIIRIFRLAVTLFIQDAMGTLAISPRMRRWSGSVYSPPFSGSNKGRKGAEAGKRVKTLLAGRGQSRWGALRPVDEEAAQRGFI